MNRSLVRIGQAVSHDRPVINSRCLNCIFCVRTVSTNSAIHRGIRRSKHEGWRETRPAPSDEADGSRPGNASRQRIIGSTKPRKPNHQQMQDVEDMEGLVNTREERRTPRQRRYLLGGRRAESTATMKSRTPVPLQRYSGGGRTVGDGSKHTSRYGGNNSRYGSSVPINNRDRADRRVLRAPFQQDRDLTNEHERPSFADRERKMSFVDQSSSPKEGSFADGAYQGKPHRYHASSSTEDSTDRRGSFLRGQGGAREHTSPLHRGASGQDAKHATSFSSVVDGAGHRRYSFTPREDNSELGGESIPQFDRVEEPRRDSRTPLSIPYTTPASEFLYGTSVITAALRASKRQLYKLYMYDGENRVVGARDKFIRKLALSRDVFVDRLKGDGISLMDKMSRGRPHNGYVLEASPLPKLPVKTLQAVKGHQSSFHATLDHQSREEEAVNGTDPKVKYQSAFPRYPFILMLDGILDPGNLGGILRTAYFFGVDAVAISARNGAPLSPVALKASAGASENLDLMSIAHPRAFIDESQKNGWKFYAAVAPSNSTSPDDRRVTHLTTSTLACPVRNHPCVLMLGGEGEGLGWNLQKKADFVLGVEGHRIGHGGVDSLNVSVATGLLCEAFLRKPITDHVGKELSDTDNSEGGQLLF